jgi:hypothetical protein
MAARLPAVLEGIWATQILLAERRRLCACAAAVLVLGVHVDTASDGVPDGAPEDTSEPTEIPLTGSTEPLETTPSES